MANELDANEFFNGYITTISVSLRVILVMRIAKEYILMLESSILTPLRWQCWAVQSLSIVVAFLSEIQKPHLAS